MRRDNARGFSLIEVMVALVLGSLIVAAAHRAFGSSADVTIRLKRERAGHDLAMNARHYLGRAFAALDITAREAVGFNGDASAVRFGTRAGGAGRVAAVRVALLDGWVVAMPDSGPVRPLLPAARLMLDYLPSMGADTAWIRGWQSPASAPVAVRMRLLRRDSGAVDTLLFIIGPRG